MAYSKSAYADELGISKKELENRAKSAGYSTTEEYYNANKGGGGSVSSIQDAIKMQQEAIRPAIESLTASLPEISNKYSEARTQVQNEIQPLQDRYNNLISSLKGNQTTAENRQTVTTSGELGKRGLLPSSTLYQQELTNALNPITEQYTGLIKDTGLQQESDLRALQNQITNLFTGETDATRAVRNAIAQMQSGAGQSGINTGLQLQQLQNQMDQFNQNMALQKAAQDLALQQYQNITLPTYQNVTVPQSSADLALVNAQIQNYLSQIQNRGSSGVSGGWE